MNVLCSAFDVNNFEENIAMKKLPKSSTLSYDGLMNTYYYPISTKETQNHFNVEFSFVEVKNPLDGNDETFLGCLVKSKYDGVGCRNRPIDIVFILDISGSMSCSLGRSSDSCLSLAKNAILKLANKLNEHDRFGLCTFDDKTYEIFKLSHIKENQNLIKKVNEIKTQGGTNLYAGLSKGVEIMKRSLNLNNEKRLIFLTDMCDLNDSKFLKLVEDSADVGIFTSIIGIGSNFNTAFAETVSKIKGVSYFSATEENHLNEIIIDQFDFNFFATSFDVFIEFRSGDFNLKRCIGTGYKEVENKNELKEWNTHEHHLSIPEFKNKVNFLLLYFNRIKKRLPMPVLAEFYNYLKYNKKGIAKIDTSFPSVLTNDSEGNFQMKGGMILMKLEKEKYRRFENSTKAGVVTINYKEKQNAEEKKLTFPFTIDFTKKENMFTVPLKRGLNAYYYAKFLRRLMKIKNDEHSKENKKFDESYLKKENIEATRKSLIDFIDANENDGKIKEELKKKIDSIFNLII